MAGRKNHTTRIILLILVAVVLITVAGVLKLRQYRQSYSKPFTPPPPVTSQSEASKNEAAGRPGGPEADNTTPSRPATAPTDPKYAGTSLPKPTGQLVSNHAVSLSSTAPESKPDEASACQTVAGATCDIRLTGSDGTVKLLGAKTVDSRGGVAFEWNAATLGLKTGKWKVEAVAFSGSQTAVSEPDYLQVSP